MEKVALDVEVDVFELQRGGDMVAGFKTFAQKILPGSQISELRLGINWSLKPLPEMTDGVFPLRNGSRRLDPSMIPTEQALVALFNQLTRTHPKLKTLQVSVKVDLEYITDQVLLVAFSINSAAPISAVYTFHSVAERTLSDALQARIAESPAKWENTMDLVEQLREADEGLEERMVMRAMRPRIPVSELGNLLMDFLRNCGGFDIDMGPDWGRGREEEEGSEEEEEWSEEEEDDEEE